MSSKTSYASEVGMSSTSGAIHSNAILPSSSVLANRILLVLMALWLALFLFNSLARTRDFGADGMNYIDVARNIVAGRGINQSTLGFNQPHFPIDDDIPTPITVQPPLYPLVTAAVTYLGFNASDAALAISALAYALLLLVGYQLTSAIFSREVAFLDSALLLVYAPLLSAARNAATETLGMSLLLLGFFLIVLKVRDSRPRGYLTFAAGMSFGLACATRYALAPSILVGLLAIGIDSLQHRNGLWSSMSQALLMVLGFALPAVPLLARNVVLTHSLMGSYTLPITYAPDNSQRLFWSQRNLPLPRWSLSGQRARRTCPRTVTGCCRA